MSSRRIETPGEDGHPLCPRCGCRVAPLMYGFPVRSEELKRALDAGEIVLGGCVVESARWGCTWCPAKYESPPEPGATWTGSTDRLPIVVNVVLPDGGQDEKMLVVTSDSPWSVELQMGSGERITAQGEDLFAAIQNLRRRTDPLGLRLCINAARRDTYRCQPPSPFNGHLVSFLTPGRPATETAWILDQAPADRIATVEAQQAHYDEWLTTPA
ncbi:hypothetical protein [Thermomonospora cellulosilytica]|uniref:Uncharacterized protein n=1 Tax=Thermomonospora cellulosilytica TaxID=1411118 RepID=A0A7W3R7K6_9ACTN|nr:hypothetical protein [Thermomonospora cellulosilytica]MBA9002624.1 hypothetical protein [Thermomonospora cellulosilytica]